jgi:hypothetical protein
VFDAAEQGELLAALCHGSWRHHGFHVPVDKAFSGLEYDEVSGSGQEFPVVGAQIACHILSLPISWCDCVYLPFAVKLFLMGSRRSIALPYLKEIWPVT